MHKMKILFQHDIVYVKRRNRILSDHHTPANTEIKIPKDTFFSSFIDVILDLGDM